MNDNEESKEGLMKEDLKKKIKHNLKQEIKEKIKEELIEEIYQELLAEENELTEEISSQVSTKMVTSQTEILEHSKSKKVPVKDLESDETLTISVKAILKIASHALKHAHSNIPREKWVEVIGILAGKEFDYGPKLHIEDVYPMGHGTAIHVGIKNYNNYDRVYKEIKKNKQFICGWYHSHPSYGTWMSEEDISTQARYQKLWENSVALVIDPYQIDGTSIGFEIFRADLKTNKWFRIPFTVEGALDVKMLPEILDFMHPIIEGKAAYLEYDED